MLQVVPVEYAPIYVVGNSQPVQFPILFPVFTHFVLYSVTGTLTATHSVLPGSKIAAQQNELP